FPDEKYDDEHAKDTKERNDNFIIPWSHHTTPLQRKEQARDHAYKNGSAEPIGFVWWVGRYEEDEGGDRDGTEREVDIKTPPPTSLIEATPQALPNEPNRRGRCSSFVICARIVRIETRPPDAPTPWMARPNMRTVMEGATPQMSDPISKRMMQM
ncbi:16990_t:CDS:2, partial [Acaulospora colombiana]